MAKQVTLSEKDSEIYRLKQLLLRRERKITELYKDMLHPDLLDFAEQRKDEAVRWVKRHDSVFLEGAIIQEILKD